MKPEKFQNTKLFFYSLFSAARGIELPPDQETLHSLLNSVQLWFGKGLLHTAVELGDDPVILDILLNAGCKLEVK